MISLANCGGCGDGTRPAAPLHSVVEETGRDMGWSIGTGEHRRVDGTRGLEVGGTRGERRRREVTSGG